MPDLSVERLPELTGDRPGEVGDWTMESQRPWKELPEGSVLRRRIEMFRKSNWSTIEHDLLIGHGITSAEPQWAEPGYAWYWRDEVISLYGKATSNGWKQLRAPAGTAAQIAHYLAKGWRLRHPSDREPVEVPSGESTEGAGVPTFYCERHQGRKLAFKGWKAYTHHLAFYQETAEYNPEDMAKGAAWYCPTHNCGFGTERLAKRHVRYHRQKKEQHIPLEAMEVKPNGNGTARDDHGEGGAPLGVSNHPAPSQLLRRDRRPKRRSPKGQVGQRGGSPPRVDAGPKEPEPVLGGDDVGLPGMAQEE